MARRSASVLGWSRRCVPTPSNVRPLVWKSPRRRTSRHAFFSITQMTPSPSELELRETQDGTILKLKVSPGARRNALGGVHAGMLRVAVTAAPEKGKANRAVLTLLGSVLGLPVRALEIIAGETAGQKSVLILGLDSNEVRHRLTSHADAHHS